MENKKHEFVVAITDLTSEIVIHLENKMVNGISVKKSDGKIQRLGMMTQTYRGENIETDGLNIYFKK